MAGEVKWKAVPTRGLGPDSALLMPLWKGIAQLDSIVGQLLVYKQLDTVFGADDQALVMRQFENLIGRVDSLLRGESVEPVREEPAPHAAPRERPAAAPPPRPAVEEDGEDEEQGARPAPRKETGDDRIKRATGNLVKEQDQLDEQRAIDEAADKLVEVIFAATAVAAEPAGPPAPQTAEEYYAQQDKAHAERWVGMEDMVQRVAAGQRQTPGPATAAGVGAAAPPRAPAAASSTPWDHRAAFEDLYRTEGPKLGIRYVPPPGGDRGG